VEAVDQNARHQAPYTGRAGGGRRPVCARRL